MPVPISVTHPKGAGIAAANPATLDTSGPFARLAAAKEAAAAATAAEAGNKQQQQQLDHQQQNLQQTDAGQDGVCAKDQQEQPAVVVQHLDFAYPGLGGEAQRRQAPSGWGRQPLILLSVFLPQPCPNQSSSL